MLTDLFLVSVLAASVPAAGGALYLSAPVVDPTSADQPPRVTTDTVAYCTELASRMEADGSAPEGARVLVYEGKAMCERGQVVAGLARVRRAWTMTHRDQ